MYLLFLIILKIGLMTFPFAINIWLPEFIQILAASNFVTMPPEPNLFFLFSISDLILSLTELTSLTIFFTFDYRIVHQHLKIE